MSTFDNLQASPVTKLLLIGDSGSGKTGALMSLIAAGYNVRILDLDNGVQVLKDYFINPRSIYLRPMPGIWTAEQAASLRQRLVFETVTDPMTNRNGLLVPKAAKAWQRSTELLDKWPGLGGISTWTPQDVLVIDSMTFIAKAAMNFTLAMNARLGQKPYQEDWGIAQGYLDRLLQMLYDDGVNCNVVVNCHMKLYGPDGGMQKWFPETLGKALSPNIGRYFNTILHARTVGVGEAQKRQIVTTSSAGLELKTTCPLRVKPAYDLATGLAEYFAAERQTDEASPTLVKEQAK
jgi:hypothetical protein